MLVLQRELNQIVMVGDNVVVKVLGIHGSKVTLGFKAPKHIAVNREEVYLGIQKAISNDKQFGNR